MVQEMKVRDGHLSLLHRLQDQLERWWMERHFFKKKKNIFFTSCFDGSLGAPQ